MAYRAIFFFARLKPQFFERARSEFIKIFSSNLSNVVSCTAEASKLTDVTTFKFISSADVTTDRIRLFYNTLRLRFGAKSIHWTANTGTQTAHNFNVHILAAEPMPYNAVATIESFLMAEVLGRKSEDILVEVIDANHLAVIVTGDRSVTTSFPRIHSQLVPDSHIMASFNI